MTDVAADGGSAAPGRPRSLVGPVVGLAVIAGLGLALALVWSRLPVPAPPAATAPPASVVATTSSDATSRTGDAGSTGGEPSTDKVFARRMYLEQAQSAGNLDRLAEGRISSFDITDRKVADATATVGIKAHFTDGTSAPGTVLLVRNKGSWFFFSMEGGRSGSSAGYAGGVDTKDNTNVDSFTDVPDSAIDWNLADELVRQQAADQTYMKSIVEGPAKRFVLGKPQEGAGTVTIDAMMYSSGKGAPEKVRIVLVPSTFEEKKSYFVTSMRAL